MWSTARGTQSAFQESMIGGVPSAPKKSLTMPSSIGSENTWANASVDASGLTSPSVFTKVTPKATAKAAAKTAPAKAGPDGQKADTQKEREQQRKIAALEKRAADAEKARDAALAKILDATDKDEEFQDAEEGGDDGAAGNAKVWQATLDTNLKENKELKGKLA